MPLEHLGARICPDMFSLAQVHNALVDRLSLAEAARHYPCIKRAWVEFLGEQPDSPVDRVDPVPG